MFQCSEPCHKETYDNEEIIKKMVLSQGFQMKDGELQKPEDGEIKAYGSDGSDSILPALR